MRSTKKAEEVEVGAQPETEVEAERKAKVKVLVAAKAEVKMIVIIIITNERQSEAIHPHTRSAQRNPKPAVQVNHERKNGDDGLGVKKLPQKHQNNNSINTKCD